MDHLLGVSKGELQPQLANFVQNEDGLTVWTVTSVKVQVNPVTGKPGHHPYISDVLGDDAVSKMIGLHASCLPSSTWKGAGGQSSCLCTTD